MTRITALRALEKAVEDEAVDGMTPHCDLPAIHVLGAYCGSLDAAKALHDALLPGILWQRGPNGQFCLFDNNVDEVSYSFDTTDSPARAWLLAIIRALIAQEGGE